MPTGWSDSGSALSRPFNSYQTAARFDLQCFLTDCHSHFCLGPNEWAPFKLLFCRCVQDLCWMLEDDIKQTVKNGWEGTPRTRSSCSKLHPSQIHNSFKSEHTNSARTHLRDCVGNPGVNNTKRIHSITVSGSESVNITCLSIFNRTKAQNVPSTLFLYSCNTDTLLSLFM